MIGKLLMLRPGFIVALYQQTEHGYYGVVVLNRDSESKAYPVGGYNILIPNDEATVAPVMDMNKMVP